MFKVHEISPPEFLGFYGYFLDFAHDKIFSGENFSTPLIGNNQFNAQTKFMGGKQNGEKYQENRTTRNWSKQDKATAT